PHASSGRVVVARALDPSRLESAFGAHRARPFRAPAAPVRRSAGTPGDRAGGDRTKPDRRPGPDADHAAEVLGTRRRGQLRQTAMPTSTRLASDWKRWMALVASAPLKTGSWSIPAVSSRSLTSM